MAGNLYEQGYYETGTASVTQGQTVVTGQGTAWLQIVRPADDFGKHVGMPVPIASVDSDTQITLAYPWPGPTQTAEPYRISFTPYHVAYRQALQEIGQLLESGNVSALADLVGAAGTFPIFSGAGAMDLADLSDYAGNGDVVGPASSTDSNVALFDGATGKVLKDGFPAGTTGKAVLAAASASAARSSIGLASVGEMRNKLINPLGVINQYGYSSGAATSSAKEYTVDRWRVVASGQSLSWIESGGVRTFTAPAGGVEQVIDGGAILSGTYTLNWEGTATATVNGTARNKGESFSLMGGANVTVRFSGGTFSKPQLEIGSSPTAFEVRHPLQELAFCQAYRWPVKENTPFPAYARNSTTAAFTLAPPSPMRTVPSVVVNDLSNWRWATPFIIPSAYSTDSISNRGAQILLTVSGLTANNAGVAYYTGGGIGASLDAEIYS